MFSVMSRRNLEKTSAIPARMSTTTTGELAKAAPRHGPVVHRPDTCTRCLRVVTVITSPLAAAVEERQGNSIVIGHEQHSRTRWRTELLKA